MKRFSACILVLLALAGPGNAGEAGVTYAYQVLDGLAEGGARIEKVYCYDHYALSGMPTAFQLIAAPNIPPSNAPRRIEDVNLTSAAGIKISTVPDSKPLQIMIDATHVRVPARFSLAAEDLLKAVLEAVRQTAAHTKITDYQVTIQANGELETYARHVLKSFHGHPKSKPFWKCDSGQEVRKASFLEE